MQKVIDQITDNLNGLITEDLPAYTPKSLLKAGIPSFIVERIRVVTEDLLLSEIRKPDSIWANFDNELVNHAWQDLIDNIFVSSHVPKDYLYSTISIVVEEVMEVLLEPRHKMADYLYRNHKVLSFDELSKRCKRLTIYKHIGVAIPMYMRKKGLDELPYERCHKLIVALDEKLVANYTANDWADKLDVLFIIFGGKVSPDIFAKFFQDKNLNRAVRYFNELDDPLNKSEFIEFMTNKGFNDLVGDEKDKEFVDDKVSKNNSENELAIKEGLVNNYFGDSSEDETTIVKQYTIDNDISEEKMLAILRDIEGKPEEVDTNFSKKEEVQTDDNDQEENLASTFKSDESDPDMNAILVDITDEGLVEEDNLEEAKSLNTLYISEEEEDSSELESSFSKEEDQKELRTNLSSILGQAKDSYEGVVNESVETDEIIVEDELILDPVDDELEEQETQDSEVDEEPDTDQEEKPMWAQFLSKDQMEVMMARRVDEPKESINDSLYVEDEDDELIIEPQEETSETLPLIDYLKKDEKSCIKALFAGKDKAYSKAIHTMEQIDNWKEASEYVEENIFSKKEVDMFSEEAIEFIDALQTYFKEHKS